MQSRISVILFLCLTAGCRSKFSTYDYKNHKFDNQVIARLPIYDSLGKAIVKHYSAIYKPTKGEPSYVYIDYQDGDEIYKDLPQDEAAKIRTYITQLGPNFFYGFDLYKDSTMKIYVRDSFLKPYSLNISERLSFFPKGTDKVRKRDYESRDTILNRNWQYWIAFDEDVDLF